MNIDANIAQWQFYNNIKFKILIALFSLITYASVYFFLFSCSPECSATKKG